MDISKVTISCGKNDCPGVASLAQSHCPLCQTPVIKRYLRLVGAPHLQLTPRTFVGEGDRYWVTDTPDIVLDTKPRLLPVLTETFPAAIESYLRLSPHLLHIPEVFGLLTPQEGWLLEYPSVPLGQDGLPQFPQLFAALTEAWATATPLQHLNWLMQIAGLLPDFLEQGVVPTAYYLEDWAIHGGIVQVQKLRFEPNQPLNLQRLGKVWEDLLNQVDPVIQPFCTRLQQGLLQGHIQQPQQLYEILHQGALELGRSQYDYHYRVYTQTDAGPSRDHNEDACFPPPGKLYPEEPLAIVCDGIGGHEQGEVASAIAIEQLQKQLIILAANPPRNRALIQEKIAEAVLGANDVICEQNDQERRQDRNRMGTTLVMGWIHGPELYLAHVGDSRIYRITATSCHQMTYDDDLGSREVRLGYALYKDALSYPGAGALVQALGMSPSHSIHPTVTTSILDQDAIYLLCSDGLSDEGQVEAHWQTEIAPLLQGAKDLTQVGERLIEIANTKNGHDNSTIALLDVRVQNHPQDLAIAFPKLTQLQPTLVQAKSTAPPAKTQMPRLRGQAPASRTSNRLLLMAIGAFCLLGISGLLWQQWRRSSTREATPPATPPLINPVPITDAPEPSSPVTLPGGELETEPIALTKNQILQLQDEANLTAATIPGATVPDTLVIPGGSILRVEEITADFQVMLKLCRSSAQTIPANSQPLTEGNNGWVALTDLEGQLVEDFVVPAVNPCGPEVE
ncbi:PP2C family serine/threonine-protein phosphatase [Picosynechococcus sp. NKBG15041c]|uniref:PP2C family protein-serine/threonine phosphatase n=1 Tax=Picosynechococcus sp. NKBG15041c TaxID=1407650 RepID=UPI000413D82D|nr:PP2C family serine/threonine-protein phosphatase [Picosynechococcus sp. NKBG15041c]